MSREDRIHTGEEAARAARLDRVIDGDDVDVDVAIAEEVSAAAALAQAYEVVTPPPREGLVALRASLAARHAVRARGWRRVLAAPKLAPIVAAAAIVAVLVSVPFRAGRESATPEQLSHQAHASLDQAQRRVDFLQAHTASPQVTADPVALQNALLDAQAQLAAAKRLAELARGEDQKHLLALVADQQRQINGLKRKVALLTPSILAAAATTTTTDGSATASGSGSGSGSDDGDGGTASSPTTRPAPTSSTSTTSSSTTSTTRPTTTTSSTSTTEAPPPTTEPPPPATTTPNDEGPKSSQFSDASPPPP